MVYNGKDPDRDEVNFSRIKNVIKAFQEKLPEMFPCHDEVTKALIFTKTDSHANDIINNYI